MRDKFLGCTYWVEGYGRRVCFFHMCGLWRERFQTTFPSVFFSVDRDATMVDHLGVLFVWDVAESLRLGGDTVDETIRRTVREVKHGDWKWYDIMILMVIKNIQLNGAFQG